MRIASLTAVSFVLLQGTLLYGQWVAPYYNNKAATAGESWARGISDVVRSAGETNLRNSEAAINVEEARSRNFDNRLKYTQTYFENRRMNREYRAAERGPRITAQQAERIARERAPKRATSQDLDPITGGIAWPRPLLDDQYASHRQEIEKLFHERAQKMGAIGMSTYREIGAACTDLLAALHENIRSYSPNDYMDAKRFVERLQNEARFPTG
jgi:hypothetical protein